MYRKANPKSIENNHYQDSAIISLYLAAMFRDRYTLYPGRAVFNAALKTLHAKDTGDTDDLPRYFRICSILHQYLMKEPRLNSTSGGSLRPMEDLMLTHEFVMFLGDAWNSITP
jgi:hypothetical protein